MRCLTAHSPYVGISPIGWALLAALSIVALLSSNPWLTLLCLWSVPVLVVMLWRRYEPPVLFFAVIVQWTEVSTKVFHANLLGIQVAEMFGDAVIVEAITRGIFGLITLAIGMRLALTGLVQQNPNKALLDVSEISIVHAWQLYCAAFLLSLVAQGSIWMMPGLTQILLPVLSLKWVFFYLFLSAVFMQRKHYGLLWVAVALEVIIGFSGYFSGFKQVFFVLGVGYLAIIDRMTGRRVAFLGTIVTLVIALAVVWMTVREDYRYFMNAGTRMQVVKRTMESRLSKLADLISEAEPELYVKGAEQLAMRVAYVDMFAHVLRHSPTVVEREEGKLWGRAIRHVLMPRILFPEKARLKSDSELTMLYTGLWLASDTQGTSISMGYMAESYIDFGPVAMFAPIFILGLLWGGMYRYFLTRESPVILRYAVATVVLISANQFGMHSTKLLGGMLMTFLVMALLLKFVLPHVFAWITAIRPDSFGGRIPSGSK
jgi:hypothetical protein